MVGGFSSDRPHQRMETTMDRKIPQERLARLHAYRNNIHRYRRLLASRLTDLERGFIERRLREEQSALDLLSAEALPFALPPAASVFRTPI
jgi:hypothetical protein